MNEVLIYLKEKGVTIGTIGVDETEERNIRLYNRLGFTDKIKDCFVDPCAVDKEMKPKPCPCFWLLSKNL